MRNALGVQSPATPAHAFVAGALILATITALAGGARAWEPSKNVELIVPAGKGGGADQMARRIQYIVNKHRLMPTRMAVVNKPGGLGLQGYLYLAEREDDPHVLLITLSNLFTAPRVLGAPFHWTDLTPVAMLAMDPFVLWVDADGPYRSAPDYLASAAGGATMGGTGAKQEDELVTRALERASPARFRYIPFLGGGEVALRLAGGHIDSSVNNPLEAVALWRAGELRPLCVFNAERLPYDAEIAEDLAWSAIPTCREVAIGVEYEMLRGIFMPHGVGAEQVEYYVDLLGRVRRTPEWRELMELGAFIPAFKAGADFAEWLNGADTYHLRLLADAGLPTAMRARPTAAREGD